jgi:hypothetical protein
MYSMLLLSESNHNLTVFSGDLHGISVAVLDGIAMPENSCQNR